MKVNEVRELSVSEAEAKLVELKTELAKEKALIVSGTRPESPGKVKKMRRTIARILTIINEKKKDEVKDVEKKEVKNVNKNEVTEKK